MIKREDRDRMNSIAEERDASYHRERKADGRDRIIDLYRSEIEMIKRLNRNFESINIRIEQL